jgi:hypothetical protein
MSDTPELPIYRYRYIGAQRLTFPSLTGYGVGELAPPDEGDAPTVIEIPVLLDHPDLEPADDATVAALAPLVDEDAPADATPSASAPVLDDVPHGTIDEVLAWVDGDPVRAATALGVENAAEDGPRITLVDALTRLANTEEH